MGILSIIGIMALGAGYCLLVAVIWEVGDECIHNESPLGIYPRSAMIRKTTLLLFLSLTFPPFILLGIVPLLLGIVALLPLFITMGLAKLVGLYWYKRG